VATRIGNSSGRGNVETGVRRQLLVAIPLLLLLQACAERDPDAGAGAAQGEERRYQTTATVLESREHGPELCLGAVLDSFPPQCGGLPIPNWGWDQVDGEQFSGGTTWGDYQLVGTYDGTAFTVIRADRPPPAPRPSAAERFEDEPKTPCQEPAGGWQVPDPSKASEADLEATRRAAGAQPDFAGIWITYLEPMGNNVAEDPGEFVLNLAFTGDLERHEAELRTHWGGRLCVTRHQRTMAELRRIQRELQGAAGRDLGLRVLSTGLSDDDNVVSLQALVLDDQALQAIAERYGAGAVRATAVLTPVG
jgi:hypothetical protein